MIAVPRIKARTFIKELSTGRTKPAVFLCYSENSAPQEYAVKFRHKLGSFIITEFMAALVGRFLDIPIPSVAIIEIDSYLASSIPNPQICTSLLKDQGPHFGSEYKSPEFTIYQAGYSLPLDLIPQAVNIFAFDMLTQNLDRSRYIEQGKPNLLFNGQEFVVIDHELAFSFIDVIGDVPPPWKIRGEKFVESHIFYNEIIHYAEKSEVSFENFLTRLGLLTDEVLEKIAKSIPPNWYDSTKVDKILSHLKTVRENIEQFRSGLLEVLA